SPEQATGKRMSVDHRTDVYSLGATLYELLTFRPPFDGGTVQEIYTQIINKDPVPPRRRNPKVPRDLETIVLKAMEKDRDRRYQSAAELAHDLRRFAEGAAIRARRVGRVERAWRQVKRHKAVAALAAAVVVASAVGGFFAWSASSEADRGSRLEYALLCAKAQEALPGARVRFSVAAKNRARYQRAFELYTEAIALRPDLPEAYLWRALAPPASLERRLEDLDRAYARGLSKDTYHLARAYFRSGGKESDAHIEEQRVSGAEPGTPLDQFFMSTVREREEPEEALNLLTRAIDGSEIDSAVGVLARWRRAQLRSTREDHAGALADLQVLRELGDDRPGVRVMIASLLRRLGSDEAAEAAFVLILDDYRASGTVGDWLSVSRWCRVHQEDAWREKGQLEALARFPISAKLLFDRAETLWKNHDRKRALEFYRRVVAADPADSLAHLRIGISLAMLERFDESLEAIDAAVLLRPDSATAHVNRGNVLKRLGRIDEALDAYDTAENLDPSNANIYINRGALFNDELDRLHDPLADFARALALGSQHPALYFNKGVVLMRQAKAAPPGSELARQKFQESLAAYELCIERNRRHFGAHWNRGYVLEKLERPEDAVGAYDAAIVLQGKHAGVHHGRVHALISLERYDQAIEAVRRAIELNQDSPHLRLDKGYILDNLDQPEQALEAFAEALRIDETFADAHEARAQLLLRQSDFAEALDAFERAISHSDAEPHFLNEVAWLMVSIPDARHHRPARAVVLARKAVAAAPKHGSFHNTLGVALYRSGKWSEALVALQESMDLRSGGDAFDWLFAAMAHWKLGDQEKARGSYRQAIAEETNDPELQRFRAEAERVLGITDGE
ncbi:MAG: tetratricopeptide repeat protein, partial [Planctomycetota bacterium]